MIRHESLSRVYGYFISFHFVQERDWVDYWRLLFPKVTVEDIKCFEQRYKGSEEESEDLKGAYLKHEGDMDHIMNEVR